MRRSACLTVALAVLVSLTLTSAGSAGATPDRGGAYVPTARGEDRGSNQSDENAEKAREQKAEEENCPVEKWTLALPIEGLACLLLLPKPPGEGEGKDGGSGAEGGGGLLQ